MLSTKNLLKPADGEPIVGPSKDMVLGVYYLTMAVDGRKHRGEGRAFSDLDEVELAYAWARSRSTPRSSFRSRPGTTTKSERYGGARSSA